VDLPRPVRALATFLVTLYVVWMLAFLAFPDPTGLGPLLGGGSIGLPVAVVAARRDVPVRSLFRFLLATLAALLAVTVAVYVASVAVPLAGFDRAFGRPAVTAGSVVVSSLAGYWLVYRDGWVRLRTRRDDGDADA
jgi:hypothetical protein